MPVSSPSYFPPSRGTDQIVGITAGQSQTGARVFLAGQSSGAYSTLSDFIAIGDEVMPGALTQAALDGSTVIGSQAYSALLGVGNSSVNAYGVTALGAFAGNAAQYSHSCVLIGTDAASGSTGSASQPMRYLTIIGANAAPGSYATFLSNTVIGALAAAGSGGSGTLFQNAVVIGDKAANSAPTGTGEQLTSSTIIGSICASGATFQNSTYDTLIGAGDSLGSGTYRTWVGAENTTTVVCDYSTALGGGITIPGKQCVLIGYGANTNAATYTSKLLIEVYDTISTSTEKMAMMADFNTGNVMLGNASTANRGLILSPSGSTNILALQTGSVDTNAPASGGYFYADANSVHWVSENGGDAPLTFGGTNVDYLTPSTGFTHTIASYCGQLQILGSTTLASGTVQFMAAPVAGQKCGISTAVAITSLTVEGNTGQNVVGAPSSLAANGFCTFQWDSGNSTWYRVG